MAGEGGGQVKEEVRKTAGIAIAMGAMNMVGYSKAMISTVCMGRLGREELAGGALGVGFTNMTGYSLLSGLAMGLDPLCSHSFPSLHFSSSTTALHRTIALLLLTSLPIALLWLNLHPLLLLLLHHHPLITSTASLYSTWMVPDLVANSMLQPVRIYLRSRGRTWAVTWSALLGVSLHIPITILLTFTFSLGVVGPAVSTFLTNFVSSIFLLLYLFRTRRAEERLLHFSESRIFVFDAQWRLLLRLSLSTCLSLCLEWWWYELMTVLAGYLPDPHVALATSAIVIQATSLMYTLPATLSSTASARVGNELGAGRAEAARTAAWTGILIAVLLSATGVAWTRVGAEAWGRLFTNDDRVLEMTRIVLPVIGMCELGNCPQTTGCGVLRGCGRPGLGARINLVAFYLVGGPVGIGLGFFGGLGILGFCYGLLAAQIVCAGLIIAAVHRTDWSVESTKARRLAVAGEEYFYTPISSSGE